MSCGCRFTDHRNDTYETLYSARSSCYSRYTIQSARCKTLFDQKQKAALRIELSSTSKYKFVIDALESAPQESRFLEVGSSFGHLTSYFILDGRNITGIDVSASAVATATAAYGPYFLDANDLSIDRTRYDAIFHVGTIGCVADPVGLTAKFLKLLKPGGRLLFNAPNRGALTLKGQLWFESAPPPDVVTLFPPDFWRNHFAADATVRETIELAPALDSLLVASRNLVGRKWRSPIPQNLQLSEQQMSPRRDLWDKFWHTFDRSVRRLAPALSLTSLAPRYPSEYGIFVEMTRT